VVLVVAEAVEVPEAVVVQPRGGLTRNIVTNTLVRTIGTYFVPIIIALLIVSAVRQQMVLMVVLNLVVFLPVVVLALLLLPAVGYLR